MGGPACSIELAAIIDGVMGHSPDMRFPHHEHGAGSAIRNVGGTDPRMDICPDVGPLLIYVLGE
jgi:hypothetical protein